MQRFLLNGKFHEYHGEAVNPKHLSLWEIYVQKWGKVRGCMSGPPAVSLERRVVYESRSARLTDS